MLKIKVKYSKANDKAISKRSSKELLEDYNLFKKALIERYGEKQVEKAKYWQDKIGTKWFDEEENTPYKTFSEREFKEYNLPTTVRIIIRELNNAEFIEEGEQISFPDWFEKK